MVVNMRPASILLCLLLAVTTCRAGIKIHPTKTLQGTDPNRDNTCPDLTCYNGQRAVRDCEGKCSCQCGPGYHGQQCEIEVTGELCNDCQYSSGQYQAGVKDNCDLFVICLPADGTPVNGRIRPSAFKAYVKSCAPGTLYITRPNGWRGCDFPADGVCKYDKCSSLPGNANYAAAGSCRSYWACGNNGRTTGRRCCPTGQAFDAASGQCTPSSTCNQRCPGEHVRCDRPTPFQTTEKVRERCRRNPNNPNEWYYLEKPNGMHKCQSGMVVNLDMCRCIKQPIRVPKHCTPAVDMDFEMALPGELNYIPRVKINNHPGMVAHFSGSSLDIILKQFAGSGFYYSHFEIDVRIKPSGQPTGSGRIALVTNANCNFTDSVSITMDSQNFYFRVTQEGETDPIELSVPFAGKQDSDGWYTLQLIYRKNDYFSGTVGIYTERYQGPKALSKNIGYRRCAIHLGHGYMNQKFVGYMDDLKIWRCEPGTTV